MLIIFFVLTASFVQGRLDVDLPNGAGRSAEAQGAVVVTLEADKRIYWQGRPVTRAELPALSASVKGREVLVAGDRSVPYGDVAELLALLRNEGVSSAGLMLAGETPK